MGGGAVKTPNRKLLLPFAAGAIFALGLAIGGMTQPGNVIAFLDITGQWDPSLAFVMAGAIAAYAPLRRWIEKTQHRTPATASASAVANKSPAKKVDRPVVAGAALFGIGWGMVGYCPGPALSSMGTLAPQSGVFVAAMLVGMALHAFSLRATSTSSRRPPSADSRPRGSKTAL